MSVEIDLCGAPAGLMSAGLCFGSAVCSLSAGLFHQQVSNYRRGSHDSVSVWTPPRRLFVVLAHICCRRSGVHPSPEPQDNALKQGHVQKACRIFVSTF